jgi:hypothetical protein
MRFESKAHIVLELMAGKRFRNTAGFVIHYDAKFQNPFRCNANNMSCVWELYGEDIWTELKPCHVHQELIDSYDEGQAWQCMSVVLGLYYDCKVNGEWVEPDWYEHMIYRLHPLNDLIKAYQKGAKIQAYNHGKWLDVLEPYWYDCIKYRIKPKTKIIYEWICKSKLGGTWELGALLLSEEEAKEYYFNEYEYRKTGREFKVEV